MICPECKSMISDDSMFCQVCGRNVQERTTFNRPQYADPFANLGDLDPDTGNNIQGDNVFCYGLRDHFGILSDGTVVPCCLDSDGVISLGNIFSEDIADIISSERVRAMVKGFDGRKASEELCRRCAYAQRFSL